MGERPGRRRGAAACLVSTLDPASPQSPLPRGRPGSGLSRELRGSGGKEKEGAARGEPRSVSLRRRRDPLGAQSATSGQGGAQSATRGQDARGARGLSAAGPLPATEGRVRRGWVGSALLDQVGVGPVVRRCLSLEGVDTSRTTARGVTRPETPKLDGRGPGRLGGLPAGGGRAGESSACPGPPPPLPQLDKGSKGAAWRAGFHPWPVCPWRFKGESGVASGRSPSLKYLGLGGFSCGSQATWVYARPSTGLHTPAASLGRVCGRGGQDGGRRQNRGKPGNV